jgi:biotin/methionine sulfoxide reductase
MQYSGRVSTPHLVSHSSHWGAFSAAVKDGRLVGVEPFAGDPDPSPLLSNFLGSVQSSARVARPLVRKGWLERGPGPDEKRGMDEFIEVSWERALDLLSAELRRVYSQHGPEACFGGSYGWASAGRFHHAQSQLHRFLNAMGGYTRSVNSYSQGAAEVIFPRVLGLSTVDFLTSSNSWPVIAEHTKLFVAFGGLPLKNAAVANGGTGAHRTAEGLRAAKGNGAKFVCISPLRDDMPAWLDAQWLPIEPGTDTALMLALAHVLRSEQLADHAFLSRYCVGYERFEQYLSGKKDGIPKTPEWAAGITGIAATEISSLARAMASQRTLLSTSWSLQRSWHGEQPMWMSVVLAAMVGQIGLPGGGLGHGYGMTASTGMEFAARMPTFPQGRNPVDSFIPVARIADMLLAPGSSYDYNGSVRRYPDIRMVYWCGGNPFHHHQDLARLARAFASPDTVVVHEPFMTATARHADIVLPATTTLERNDIGGASMARHVFAMKQAIAPVGEARNDYAIFSALGERLGVHAAFTEGRDEMQWLRHLYRHWREDLPTDVDRRSVPEFDAFWEQGVLELSFRGRKPQVLLQGFRETPDKAPLRTPSGRIEIWSETIAGFGYADCAGHPEWRAPLEWRGTAAPSQLMLIANNPRSRLHSQLDNGEYSRSTKVAGREPVRLNPEDARARGIAEGDVVRLFNARGSCLAGAVLSDALRPGVVQLSTGAWLDVRELPGVGAVCINGNPNILTEDRGTSRLAQGAVGQLCLVEIEKFNGPVPSTPDRENR